MCHTIDFELKWGAMWCVTWLEVNRGREDINGLKVEDFHKKEDTTRNFQYWVKVFSLLNDSILRLFFQIDEGVSKGHHEDLQGNEDDKGILPYFQITKAEGANHGFNPGRIFEAHRCVLIF